MTHIHQEVPLPRSLDPDIEPRLEATLLKALAKDPDDRFQTATELVHMLDPVQFTEEYEPVSHDPYAAGPETLEAGIVSGYHRAPDQESIGSIEGTISFVMPSQARLVAIRHARENPEFYGLRYTGVRMASEVVSQEADGEFYEIRLHYRPAGKFRGQPGLEEFTVSKTGQVELRQILDEPSGTPWTAPATSDSGRGGVPCGDRHRNLVRGPLRRRRRGQHSSGHRHGSPRRRIGFCERRGSVG